MPKKRHNELLAGIFVLLALAVGVGIVCWLGASDLFRRPQQRAAFYAYESAGSMGLEKGASVLVGDRVVGKITEIRSGADGKILYITDIAAEDVKVHSDGQAQVASKMVGSNSMAITSRGSADKPLADESNPVRLVGGLDQAMNNISAATDSIAQIAKTLQKEFDPAQRESILAQAHQAIGSLAQAAGNIAKQTDPQQSATLMAKLLASTDDIKTITSSISSQTNAGNTAGLLAKILRAADDIDAITADAKPKVSDTLTSVKNTAQQLEAISKKDLMEILAGLHKASDDVLKISGNFVKISEDAKTLVTVNRDRIDEMIENMGQVSENLKSTSKEVRRNPWRLLYTPDKQELHSQNIYDAARAFNDGAEQLDAALGKLRALAKQSPAGLPANDPELAKIRKQIEETFSNFSKAEQALWKEVAK